MELDPPLRARAVRDCHQNAVAGPRDRLERVRQRLRDAQRVVADRLELAGDPREQLRPIVQHCARPAVHRLARGSHRRPGQPAQALVAKADAE
jgi:hypothetical protein